VGDSSDSEKLTTKEAADFIRRRPQTLRRYVAEGQLQFYRLSGGQMLFDRAELERWLRVDRPRPKRPARKAKPEKTGPEVCVESRSLTFKDLVAQYLESSAFANVALATQRMYRERLAVVAKRFGKELVLSITAADAEEFAKKRQDDGVSGTTVHHDLATMFRVLYWGIENHFIPYMPFSSKGLMPKRGSSVKRGKQ
jgi:excisionase family DNA binding protein